MFDYQGKIGNHIEFACGQIGIIRGQALYIWSSDKHEGDALYFGDASHLIGGSYTSHPRIAL